MGAADNSLRVESKEDDDKSQDENGEDSEDDGRGYASFDRRLVFIVFHNYIIAANNGKKCFAFLYGRFEVGLGNKKALN